MKEKLSVCIPVYNGEKTIIQSISSILSQTYKDFELVVIDNASTDATVNLIKKISDKRLKIYENLDNLGCAGNLNECRKKATGDILFFLSADDIADKYALEKVMHAFKISSSIGIVTRPYFWFEDKFCIPVRITKQFSKDQLISINASSNKITSVIATSDQISGIAFRKRYMKDFLFSDNYFIEMASMFLPVFKISKAYILKDNIVAVRTTCSGAKKSKVYKISPMMSWFNLISDIFYEERFANLKKYLINNFVANNYIGLIQLKNYGGYRYLFREIYYLLKLKWINIFSYKFWFYSLLTLITPSFILKKLLIFFKNNINNKLIKFKKINFNHEF